MTAFIVEQCYNKTQDTLQISLLETLKYNYLLAFICICVVLIRMIVQLVKAFAKHLPLTRYDLLYDASALPFMAGGQPLQAPKWHHSGYLYHTKNTTALKALLPWPYPS